MRSEQHVCATALLAVVLLALPLAPLVGPSAPPEVAPAGPEPTEALPVIPIAIAAGIAGFLGGYFYAKGGVTGTAGSQEIITDDYRYNQAYGVFAHTNWAMNPTVQGLEIDSETVLLTENFYSRVIEAETSSQWVEGGGFDVSIVGDTTMPADLLALTQVWGRLIADAWETDKDARSKWAASDDYRDLRVWFSVGSAALGKNLTGQQYARALPAVDVPNDGVSVWLGEETDVVVRKAQITITSPTGTAQTYAPGEYADVDFAPGMYSVTGGGALFAGDFFPIDCDVKGSLYVVSGAERYLCVPDEMGVRGYAVEKPILAGNLKYNVSYPDVDGIERIMAVELAELVEKWDKLLENMQSVAINAVSAGRNAWAVFDMMGEASPFLSPSSLIPPMRNVTLTEEQRYVISLLGMYQLKDWFTGTDSDPPDLGDVDITAESLDLYIKGKVRDEGGNVLVEDVIYTPFGYSRDAQITTSETMLWTQPGVVIVWANSEDWRGVAIPSQMKIIPISGNYLLNAEEITYKGKSVPSMVLTVKSLREIEDTLRPQEPQPIRPIPQVVPLGPYVAVIVALLGVLLATVGLVRKSLLLIILGGVVVALGVLGGDAIAGYLVRLY